MGRPLYKLIETFYFSEHKGRQPFVTSSSVSAKAFIRLRSIILWMPQKLLQHKHCITCGKAILVTEEFCSEECESNHAAVLGKKRRQLMLLWLAAMGVVVLAVILSLG